MITAKTLTKEILAWWNQECDEKVKYISEILTDMEGSLGSAPVSLPSGELKLVDQFGGEGEGDTYWLIFKIGEQFFKAEGFHDSWSGVSWDDDGLREVEARQVVITQYFDK